jgi:lysophospholipase L1-like esterase
MRIAKSLCLAGWVCGVGAAAAGEPSFAAFDHRAAAGERLTVVFFGASLTWGANASDQGLTSCRALLGQRLEAAYPKAHFTFRDAAIGGTGSQLGVFRLERDVLRHKPDLVFLDFTANDGIEWATPETLASYEALVRRIVQAGAPVVQVIFPFKWNIEGRTSIDDFQRRAKHIELSRAYHTGLGDAVALIFERVKAGTVKLNDLWPLDGVHPGDAGYVQFADAAWDGFQQAVREGRVCTLPSKMLTADTYQHSARVRLSTLTPLPAGWVPARASVTSPVFDMQMSRWLDDVTVATPAAAGVPFEVRFRGSMAMLFGESTPKSCPYRVILDGQPLKRANAKPDDPAPELFDAGALGKIMGGTVHLSDVLATGLNPAVEHVLRIEPVHVAGGGQEMRVESIGVAGGENPGVWRVTAPMADK